MQRVICNEQIHRGRIWLKITATASTNILRCGVNKNTLPGFRIMSTMNSAAPSMNMNQTRLASSILTPLAASQNSDRSHWSGSNYDFKWTNAMTAVITAVFGATAVQMNQTQKSRTECCGIAGVVGSSKNHDARYVTLNCVKPYYRHV